MHLVHEAWEQLAAAILYDLLFFQPLPAFCWYLWHLTRTIGEKRLSWQTCGSIRISRSGFRAQTEEVGKQWQVLFSPFIMFIDSMLIYFFGGHSPNTSDLESKLVRQNSYPSICGGVSLPVPGQTEFIFEFLRSAKFQARSDPLRCACLNMSEVAFLSLVLVACRSWDCKLFMCNLWSFWP